MNSSLLRRFLSLTVVSLSVLPLCVLIAATAAHAAPTTAPPPTAAPTTAAPPAAAEASIDETWEQSDDTDVKPEAKRHFGRHNHRYWHDRHEHGNDLVHLGHDSNLPRGETADSVVSIFGSSTSDGEAGVRLSLSPAGEIVML